MRSLDHIRPEHIVVTFDSGGLGDHIARVPVVQYLLKTYPTLSIELYAPDYTLPLLEHYFHGYPRLEIKGSSRAKEMRIGAKFYNHSNQWHTSLRTHLTKHSFHVIADMGEVTWEMCNYPKLDVTRLPPFTIGCEYVVFTPGFTSRTREMPGQVIEKLAIYCKSRGLLPVFLGKTENTHAGTKKIEASWPELNYNVGLDLRDKTTLLESARILAGAVCVVGLDNGLIHIAGTTDRPIVAGYSSVDATTRLPVREGVLGLGCFTVEPKGDCKSCQTVANFTFGHDFRLCYYGDYKCLGDTPDGMETMQWQQALAAAITSGKKANEKQSESTSTPTSSSAGAGLQVVLTKESLLT
jgi:hypothetical protein